MDALACEFNRPETVRWLTGIPQTFSGEACRRWLLRMESRVAAGAAKSLAFEENGHALAGGISLDLRTAEIGFWIRHDLRGLGVGTQMVNSFIDEHLAEFPFRFIVASVALENVVSERLLVRCGFEHAGNLPYRFPNDASATMAGIFRRATGSVIRDVRGVQCLSANLEMVTEAVVKNLSVAAKSELPLGAQSTNNL